MSGKEIEDQIELKDPIENDIVVWQKTNGKLGFGRVYSAFASMMVIEKGNHRERVVRVERSEATVVLRADEDLRID